MRRKVTAWEAKRWDATLECGHVWVGDSDDGYVSTEEKEYLERKGGIDCSYCDPKPTVDDRIRYHEEQIAKLRQESQAGGQGDG